MLIVIIYAMIKMHILNHKNTTQIHGNKDTFSRKKMKHELII